MLLASVPRGEQVRSKKTWMEDWEVTSGVQCRQYKRTLAMPRVWKLSWTVWEEAIILAMMRRVATWRRSARSGQRKEHEN